MSSITGTFNRSIVFPSVPQELQLPVISAQGMAQTFKGLGVALYAVFVPMFFAYFIARGFGLSTLCYDGLHEQASFTGLAILPFSLYCIAVSSKKSVRTAVAVTMVVSAILGTVCAAIV